MTKLAFFLSAIIRSFHPCSPPQKMKQKNLAQIGTKVTIDQLFKAGFYKVESDPPTFMKRDEGRVTIYRERDGEFKRIYDGKAEYFDKIQRQLR